MFKWRSMLRSYRHQTVDPRSGERSYDSYCSDGPYRHLRTCETCGGVDDWFIGVHLIRFDFFIRTS